MIGRHYLKIGHFRDYNLPLCPNEIASWFQGDFHPVRERTKKHLMKAFAETFPGKLVTTQLDLHYQRESL